MPIRLLALFRKKPVDLMIASTSAWRARGQRLRASGSARTATGVTRLTRASVHWADRMVAHEQLERVAVVERALGVGIRAWRRVRISGARAAASRVRRARPLRRLGARAARRASPAFRRAACARNSSAGRAFSTSSGPSHAFRAMPTPYSTLAIPATLCASAPIEIATPRSRARRTEPPVEVEPVRVGVDLEGHAGGRRLLDHGVEVEAVGIAREQQPAGRVPDDREVAGCPSPPACAPSSPRSPMLNRLWTEAITKSSRASTARRSRSGRPAGCRPRPP